VKLREFPLQSADLDLIREAMAGLARSEDVVILKRGATQIPKERWIELLEHDVGLVPDRRHFTPKWAADDAKRLEGAFSEAAAGRGSVEALLREKQRSASGKDPEMTPADWWEISYQPDKATAYAYSNTRQPLHTDNAWFADPAEINFFIMQKQAVQGGEQTVYPLSRLIDDLSTEEPTLFRDLTSVRVTIKKGENDYFNQTPVIQLSGEPRVYWNFYRTERPTAEISRMCDAFFAFLEKKESTASVEKIRCDSGDCLSFNDLRMLHGRTAFVATKARDRVLLHSMWKLPPGSAAAA
jgi:hypothetical protein